MKIIMTLSKYIFDSSINKSKTRNDNLKESYVHNNTNVSNNTLSRPVPCMWISKTSNKRLQFP